VIFRRRKRTRAGDAAEASARAAARAARLRQEQEAKLAEAREVTRRLDELESRDHFAALIARQLREGRP
jgi:hypothetical protein